MESDHLLKSLRKKRGIVKGHLTRFQHFLDNCDEDQVPQLQVRIKKFELCYNEFSEIQTEIELLENVEDNERETFENNYFNCMARAEGIIKTNTQNDTVFNNTTMMQQNTTQNTSYLKLPTLKLPSFNGEYDQWLLYYDTFTSIIDANETITPVMKFQYLRSSLTGDALQIINCLEISADNYNIAWNLLKKRYQNTRLIVHNHMKAIYDLPSVQKDSHISLRSLVDNLQKHLRALESLMQPVKSWDTILIYQLSQKLDSASHREWEELVSRKEHDILPTTEEFVQFLNQRAQVLEVLNRNTKSVIEKPKTTHNVKVTGGKGRTSQSYTSETSTSHVTTSNKCTMCSQGHPLYACDQFLKLSISDRVDHVKKYKLCFNCLHSDHQTKDCISGSCRKCEKKHNSLLHLTGNTSQSQAKPLNAQSQESSSSCHTTSPSQTVTILLSTAVVRVYDRNGHEKELRVLLDSGSQSHFITEEACDLLQLKPTQSTTTVTGISESLTPVHQEVTTTIQSRITSYKATLKFLVMKKITGSLPLVNISRYNLNIPQNIQLADPSFFNTSQIDMLIGAEIFFDLLCIGQFRPSPNSPLFQKTKLGYIVSGRVASPLNKQKKTVCHFTSQALDATIERFWALEEVNTHNKCHNSEEIACDQHFSDTFERSPEGRFTVRLPFKGNISQLGNSNHNALQRFHTLERKLLKNTDTRTQYVKFMEEYEELGHMSRTEDMGDDTSSYYLPHHSVTKDDSLTTKLRVVFDGSAKTSSGISLNDTLMKGPTIQDDLIDILLRFRKHNIVLTADITKMYRQININKEDAKYQLIFWRQHPSEHIKTYQLNTVTYGTTTAPFLAIRCLHQLASDEECDFPEAADILKNDFYVDDLLTGTDTHENAEKIMHDLSQLLTKGCFELRKWRSNTQEVLRSLVENQTDKSVLTIEKRDAVKTLGLLWNSQGDTFQFSVRHLNQSTHITKRTILSIIAQIFDPLGLIGPVITKAKVIMQQLWELKLGWDESIPELLHTTWKNYQMQLIHLNQVLIPRQYTSHKSFTEVQIHGFCDASQVAYGACVYMRTTDSRGNHSSRLLCSKSRVAPLKTISLPRLELCGALLLTRLISKVKNALHIVPDETYYWTDSTITLAWITAPANRWKTFVSNRVSEIQTLSQQAKWLHVNTKENPAYIISRGNMPMEIINSALWWTGPLWLTQDKRQWPQCPETKDSDETLTHQEARKVITVLVSSEPFEIWQRYSSLSKLVRVVAYCFRFRHNVLNKTKKNLGPLLPHELTHSTNSLVKAAQTSEFSREIKELKKGGKPHTRSRLITLNPFIDQDGIIRVGGRLQHSTNSYDTKHPMLLPAKHTLTKLIITHEHKKQLHAGPQATLAAVRTMYWPISARNAVRQIVRACIPCFKVRPKLMHHIMGDLPQVRTQQVRPFYNCGVDFCGPFSIREGLRKNKKVTKAYGAIFVCMSTKAVHIELVSTLSTEYFLNALKRFISRRGKPGNMYSDNATNFKGASKELHDLHALFATQAHQDEVINLLSEDRIQWHFIPSRAPHFGGLWEAGVKSMKHHLRRVAGDASLTFEQLYTLLVQIEACLNSRPICPLSNDPNDLSFLTPGHFLIGNSLTAIAEPDLTAINVGRLSQWQYVQQIQQHFWKRWVIEYVSELQQRKKWAAQRDPILEVGNLVIIREDNIPAMQWTVGRVEEIHPGHDGIVRAATIRTTTGRYKRPTTKLGLLPIEDNLKGSLSRRGAC